MANKTNNPEMPKTTTMIQLQSALAWNATTLIFDDYVLVAANNYTQDKMVYHGALFRFTTNVHNVCGEIELVSVSDKTFKDDGHAIAWAMSEANRG